MTNSPPDTGTDTETGAAAQEPGKPAGIALALIPLAMAQLMITLDSTIVSVALPTLQPDVGLTNAARAWTVTGYTVAFGSLLLLNGRLGDLIGRKRALIIGAIGFAVVSGVAGAAVNAAMFVGARALQGAFAALIAPSALALISTTFTEPRQRGRALGVYAATAMAGGGVGLIVGGALTDYLSWRWCMYVNIPIAAVVALGTLFTVASPPRHPGLKLDIPGAVLVTVGMVGLIYGLAEAGESGWDSGKTIGALIAGAALIAAFAAWQARTASPLLPLRVVLHRSSSASFLAMMISAFCTFGMMLGMTYQLQTVLNYSPMKAGFAFIGFVGTAVVSSTQIGRRLVTRLRPGVMMALGLVLYAVALLLVTRLTVGSSYWVDIFPPMALMGIGVGILTVPIVATVMAEADARDSGVVAAIVNTMQQAGGSVGAALLNTISVSAAAAFVRDGRGDAVAASIHGFILSSRWSAAIAIAGALIAVVAVNTKLPRKE
ncbi:MFS transporter [Actinomadura rayongensis]|uniref:MFS transporter n=1 Tax=Actinomadura rayongensis TaxID=1429076 RepID=A0A6I4VYU1_9ACTN|nr:MFS transporter [Actinomadura rayongensis]MXQ63519.1 MFS transporter [Actinomadura rayongensis]